jgi:hypothetical protein
MYALPRGSHPLGIERDGYPPAEYPPKPLEPIRTPRWLDVSVVVVLLVILLCALVEAVKTILQY